MTAVSCFEPFDLGGGAREFHGSFSLHGDTLALNESSQMSVQLAGLGAVSVEEVKCLTGKHQGGQEGHMLERMQQSGGFLQIEGGWERLR